MWTAEQLVALKQEYARIGSTDKQWPYPHPEPTPDEFLTMLRRVPDGAGLPGYIQVLNQRAGQGT